MADTAITPGDAATNRGMSGALYTRINQSLIEPLILTLPAASQDQTRANTQVQLQQLCNCIAATVMDYVAVSSGAFPALYCNVPGLTEITDVNQIGVSKTTMVGQ
jgi:hypothetical protein